MPTIKTHKKSIKMLILAFTVFYSLFSPIASYAHKILINKSSSKETLTPQEVKIIFLGRKKHWNNGLPIQVIVYKEDNDSHLDFCREIIGVPPITFKTSWNRIVFSGVGNTLKYVSTPEEMIEKIQNTDGAIGYILSNEKENTQLNTGGVNVVQP